ncbi:ABC transporter substrate-binding protein [Natronococcus pandeyae]|uniref:ABC transporter substrate-binding protein n=1 Tax=Natronococcus pandeyae TaxID=2055836 RepID=A0A8J8PW16_9EURY|nr:ABC transporter substrate-binding protein [Natronococcus pandeyae]TYL35921.1 ABC transporter substrate-binding protein [Natronococcus pandeyae]
MNRNSTNPGDGVSRRSVLATAASGLALSTSGCIDRVGSVVGQDVTDRLALSITTVPADSDREAVRIARHLEANLEAVGADVSIDMRSPSEFLQTVLIDHDFDLYVGRHPGGFDPDFLYGALHSRYADERGWQNPFGFDETQPESLSGTPSPSRDLSETAPGGPSIDELLEEQRRTNTDDDRRDVIADLLEEVVEQKPFDPICFPEEYRVARTEHFGAWDVDDDGANDGHLPTRHGFLGLEPEPGVDQLRALITDTRPTRNLNPLSATIRDRGTIVNLLYDSLLTEHQGELVPWLAESVEWEDGSLHITLREECPFHDDDDDDEADRYVTAEDVAFTYEFLADTSYGEADTPSPAPRYRSQTSMIDDPSKDIVVEDFLEDDSYELRIDVATNIESVARRALTVPILPKHRWENQVESRTESAEAPQGEWGLVTMSNIPAIGSGPFRFEDSSQRESLTLERFEDHFTQDDDDLPDIDVESIQFGIDPGSTAVERVANDGADVTASMLSTHALKGRLEGDGEWLDDDETSETRWIGPRQSRMFYHVGFNTRAAAFGDSSVRRLVSQLLDKSWIIDDVFGNRAKPIAAPLSDEWVPDTLAMDEDDEEPVTPFFGSDGELDVDAARDAFEDAGFRHDEQGWLLRNDDT